MEKDRSAKIIAIVALVVAVAGVSLGFAAFSQNLTINPKANVKADKSKFKVQFSTKQEAAETGDVTATLSPNQGVEGFEAQQAKLAATTIDNLKATFVNGKGKQTATYSFYVYNAGELDAYLKSVTFEKEATCSSSAGQNQATDSLVQAACKDVSVKVTVDSEEYTTTTSSISGETLSKSSSLPVTVVLEYSDKNAVDGDFDVDFGSITLNYSSSDGE